MRSIDVIREVLDKKVVDRTKIPIGRVDGVVLDLNAGDAPRVEALEMGFATLARRLGARFERLVEVMRERFSVRRTARQRISWEQVIDLDPHHVQVDVDGPNTPAFDWERWLRTRVVEKVPGESQ